MPPPMVVLVNLTGSYFLIKRHCDTSYLRGPLTWGDVHSQYLAWPRGADEVGSGRQIQRSRQKDPHSSCGSTIVRMIVSNMMSEHIAVRLLAKFTSISTIECIKKGEHEATVITFEDTMSTESVLNARFDCHKRGMPTETRRENRGLYGR